MLAVASLTFVAGFIPALRFVWFVHLMADAALSLYVWRLLRLKRDEVAGPVFNPQPAVVTLGEAAGPSIQTFRLDPEPSIAPAADQPATAAEQQAAAGWMIRTG